jgi:outer membrane protein OmpA-like peptidoglycan-associated protein
MAGMTMKCHRRLAAAAVCLAAGAFATASCSSSSGSGTTITAALSCTDPHGLELIIGAHRNAPEPSPDPALVCQITTAIRAGEPVRIMVASGRPRLITPHLESVTGGTLAEQNSPRVQQDVQRILTAIADARPDSPGIDDLEALSVAADAARTAGDPHAELVLIDSGLDDRGALNFTGPGMLAAAPAEVAQQLKASGNLPDLRGFTVLLVGLGYTAPPQAPLSAKWRSSVTQIWVTVVKSAGSTVEIIPQPGQGPSVSTGQPVRAVRVPATQSVFVPPTLPGKPHRRTIIIFTQESPVRFWPDSTAFIDPAAAVQALTPIARWLAADPSRHAWLEGTTADVGPMSGQVALAKLRAEHVRAELITLGASSAQISATGVGSNFPQFTPDRNASGILLAGRAALNRSVRITLN